MSETMQLEIVSSTETAVKASIKELYVPAFNGKAGILENHKPYLTLLIQGEIFYTDIQGKKFYIFIRDGFMEVKNNHIVIISDAIEKGESLNKTEIDAKLTELNLRIQTLQKKEMTPEELKAAPDKLQETLLKIKEFEIKHTIIQEMELSK